MRHQVFAICAAAGLAVPAFAQDIPGNTDLPNSNPPVENPAGNNGPDDLFGNLAEIKEVKEQIDGAIAEVNDEFKSLLEQDSLSFGDMRRLAELRQELGEEVAPELVAQIAEIKASVAEQGNVGAGDRLSIARPELSDEQKAAVEEHKDALAVKRDELNAILVAADDSGRYEELLNDEDKTVEEKQELRELRRTLIDGSEDATAKVQEIREFNQDFRKELRDSFDRPILPRPNVRAKGQALAKLEGKVNDILAQSSSEFADLLAQEDKSEEDLARLAELKTELIQNANDDVAAQLQETKATFARISQQRHNRRRGGQADRTRDLVRAGILAAVGVEPDLSGGAAQNGGDGSGVVDGPGAGGPGADNGTSAGDGEVSGGPSSEPPRPSYNYSRGGNDGTGAGDWAP